VSVTCMMQHVIVSGTETQKCVYIRAVPDILFIFCLDQIVG